MPRTNFQELLDAGVHFGHLARKWNPKMAPYIFDQKNGIHIIDLHKTIVKIDEAADAMKELARSGRKILFVATKKQAKEIVAEKATAVNMPSITERWAGGMLTNFPTIRKAIKKMNTIDKMKEDGTFEKLAKRERLQINRQREKLEKNLGSIKDMSRLPSALFVVDIQKEANAVKEANRLNIPVFALVDTCCDPTPIDYVIPANDDATKSIETIMTVLCKAIEEGLSERKLEKEKEANEEAAEGEPAAQFVTELIEKMGISGKVLAAREEDAIRLRIDSDTMGVLIGHRGETLDAIQYLTGLVINRNRKVDGYTRVTINTEDYREKREETLIRLARRVAAQVKSTGRPRTLEAMNPYERRILHSALQNNPYVTTHSEGEEPNRRAVVAPKRGRRPQRPRDKA